MTLTHDSLITLYTLGHSNRSFGELIELLLANRIEFLVDVRAYPGSRRHPEFSRDALHDTLESADIQYHWAGRQLGGLRKPIQASPHIALPEDGMRGYADHMDTEAFKLAATQLIKLAARGALAILCAERLPEHCHRALIADYLTLQGIDVVHLIDEGRTHAHRLNPMIRRESARLVYDRNAQGTLDLPNPCGH